MKQLLIFILLLGNALIGMSQCLTVAAFNLDPSKGCTLTSTVFFTNQSTLSDTWLWEFGDGSTSPSENPIHSYTSSGTFIVTLSIENTATGCTDQISHSFTVSIPTADFIGSGTFGCGPLSTTFTDNSTDDGSLITSWSWNFGDGNTSIEQNPSHIYDEPGTYTVALTIADANGCSITKTRTNFIQVIGPNVNFGADVFEACNALTVNFTNNTISGSPIISWAWDFGDGNNSNSKNPSHSYTAPGNFDVSLTVSDLDGCARTFSRPQYITVNGPANGTDVQVACNSYTWIDGNTYTASNNSATHNIVGGAATGCDSLVTLDLTINTTVNTATTTSGNTITSSAAIASYQWLDCTNSMGIITGETNQSFSATANGDYAVEVTEGGCIDTSDCVLITTVNGIKNSLNESFIVYPNPTKGIVAIEFDANQENLYIRLVSLSGQLLETRKLINSNRIEIEIDQPNGIYLLEISDENDDKAVLRIEKE